MPLKSIRAHTRGLPTWLATNENEETKALTSSVVVSLRVCSEWNSLNWIRTKKGRVYAWKARDGGGVRQHRVIPSCRRPPRTQTAPLRTHTHTHTHTLVKLPPAPSYTDSPPEDTHTHTHTHTHTGGDCTQPCGSGRGLDNFGRVGISRDANEHKNSTCSSRSLRSKKRSLQRLNLPLMRARDRRTNSRVYSRGNSLMLDTAWNTQHSRGFQQRCKRAQVKIASEVDDASPNCWSRRQLPFLCQMYRGEVWWPCPLSAFVEQFLQVHFVKDGV